MGDWEKESAVWSCSLSSDFDDVCHCEGKCAERGTDVDVRADTGFVVAFAQYVTKT